LIVFKLAGEERGAGARFRRVFIRAIEKAPTRGGTPICPTVIAVEHPAKNRL